MSKIKKTPGTLLLEYLAKYDQNCNNLAKDTKCSQTTLRLICIDKNRITTSIAIRLAKYFSTKPELWLLTQMETDLIKAAGNKTLNKQLNGISKASLPTEKSNNKNKPVVDSEKIKKRKNTIRKARKAKASMKR